MNINDVIVQAVQNNSTKVRKRGRPRKNSVIPTKAKTYIEPSKTIEEDIILHLPLSKRDVEEQKIYDSNNDGMELIKTECNEHFSSDSSNEVNVSNSITVKQLMKIIDDKNKIIECLEEKIKKISNCSDVSVNIPKNITIHELTNIFEHNDKNEIIIPEHTTNACLWDTCEINGTPCFLPDKFSDNKFYVIGCFCSLNCAMAYNLSLDDYRVNERYSLLKWLYGKTQEIIVPSPSFKILRKFGGKLTIDEYRQKLKCNDTEYRIISAPMTYIRQTLEERIIKTPTKSRQETILDVMYNNSNRKTKTGTEKNKSKK
jgi:hypothetical protein